MEIFIDSANITEIEKWLSMGVIDGVTTNPSIMLKDGIYDAEAGAKEIAALVNPRPVSVEVTTNDLDEMVVQAQLFCLMGTKHSYKDTSDNPGWHSLLWCNQSA